MYTVLILVRDILGGCAARQLSIKFENMLIIMNYNMEMS